MDENQFLEFVSRLTIESIEDLKIITPEIFESKFNDIFNTHNSYGFGTKISNEYFLNFDKRIESQSDSLSNNISKASDAIKNNDVCGLEEVKKQVELLKEELKKTKEELYKDSLTGSYNRKWLSEVLCFEDKFLKNGVLAFIDLNEFKYINDNFGHNIGDKVLMVTSKLFNDIPNSKTIRFAGDEFIIFSETMRLPELEKKLEDIYKFLETKKLNTQETFDKVVKIRFSFGITKVSNGDDRKETIEKADKLMYEDKMRRKEGEM